MEDQKHETKLSLKMRLSNTKVVMFSDVVCAGDQTVTFSQVVLEVMRHLEGAYALIFKSRHYPNELIACKRGSPLLLGVKVGFAYSFLS